MSDLPTINPIDQLNVLGGPLGDDVYCFGDLDPHLRLVGGLANLGQALAHRLITQRGTLFYDLNYGTDTRLFLNETIDPAFLSFAKSQIQSECLKDERVLTCTATLTFALNTDELDIKVSVTTAAGPFIFIFSVTSTSISLI